MTEDPVICILIQGRETCLFFNAEKRPCFLYDLIISETDADTDME